MSLKLLLLGSLGFYAFRKIIFAPFRQQPDKSDRKYKKRKPQRMRASNIDRYILRSTTAYSHTPIEELPAQPEQEITGHRINDNQAPGYEEYITNISERNSTEQTVVKKEPRRTQQKNIRKIYLYKELLDKPLALRSKLFSDF